jgi:hypothetical protein
MNRIKSNRVQAVVIYNLREIEEAEQNPQNILTIFCFFLIQVLYDESL